MYTPTMNPKLNWLSSSPAEAEQSGKLQLAQLETKKHDARALRLAENLAAREIDQRQFK